MAFIMGQAATRLLAVAVLLLGIAAVVAVAAPGPCHTSDPGLEAGGHQSEVIACREVCFEGVSWASQPWLAWHDRRLSLRLRDALGDDLENRLEELGETLRDEPLQLLHLHATLRGPGSREDPGSSAECSISLEPSAAVPGVPPPAGPSRPATPGDVLSWLWPHERSSSVPETSSTASESPLASLRLAPALPNTDPWPGQQQECGPLVTGPFSQRCVRIEARRIALAASFADPSIAGHTPAMAEDPEMAARLLEALAVEPALNFAPRFPLAVLGCLLLWRLAPRLAASFEVRLLLGTLAGILVAFTLALVTALRSLGMASRRWVAGMGLSAVLLGLGFAHTLLGSAFLQYPALEAVQQSIVSWPSAIPLLLEGPMVRTGLLLSGMLGFLAAWSLRPTPAVVQAMEWVLRWAAGLLLLLCGAHSPAVVLAAGFLLSLAAWFVGLSWELRRRLLRRLRNWLRVRRVRAEARRDPWPLSEADWERERRQHTRAALGDLRQQLAGLSLLEASQRFRHCDLEMLRAFFSGEASPVELSVRRASQRQIRKQAAALAGRRKHRRVAGGGGGHGGKGSGSGSDTMGDSDSDAMDGDLSDHHSDLSDANNNDHSNSGHKGEGIAGEGSNRRRKAGSRSPLGPDPQDQHQHLRYPHAHDRVHRGIGRRPNPAFSAPPVLGIARRRLQGGRQAFRGSGEDSSGGLGGVEESPLAWGGPPSLWSEEPVWTVQAQARSHAAQGPQGARPPPLGHMAHPSWSPSGRGPEPLLADTDDEDFVRPRVPFNNHNNKNNRYRQRHPWVPPGLAAASDLETDDESDAASAFFAPGLLSGGNSGSPDPLLGLRLSDALRRQSLQDAAGAAPSPALAARPSSPVATGMANCGPGNFNSEAAAARGNDSEAEEDADDGEVGFGDDSEDVEGEVEMELGGPVAAAGLPEDHPEVVHGHIASRGLARLDLQLPQDRSAPMDDDYPVS